VRSTSIATVRPGVGLFAYAVVTLLLTALTAAGLQLLWQLKNESNAHDLRIKNSTPKRVQLPFLK
jgi:paraquat-inducible protein A